MAEGHATQDTVQRRADLPDPFDDFEVRLEAAFNNFWANLNERMKQAPQTTPPQVRKQKLDGTRPEKFPRGNPTARPTQHTTIRLPGPRATRGNPPQHRPHTQKGPNQQRAPLRSRDPGNLNLDPRRGQASGIMEQALDMRSASPQTNSTTQYKEPQRHGGTPEASKQARTRAAFTQPQRHHRAGVG
ncbi:Hypothetical predicted protein [Pelobates cultripes]|uniref:Uncharacterized protein n=1 Tax=Pelobates cultripes TaxID=61616 RepID=A0AAD1SQ90_PELCU|nr:Hypothetical predicted protein [Pelobates cultripes]